MTKAFIIIAVACDSQGVIAYQNRIPWDIPSEKTFFKKLIQGQVSFMGRGTYDAMPAKYFQQHEVYVLSNNAQPPQPNKPAHFYNNFDQMLQALQQLNKTVYCLGGESIYRLTLQSPYLLGCYVSYVQGNFIGDRFFPLQELKRYSCEVKEQHPDWQLIYYDCASNAKILA